MQSAGGLAHYACRLPADTIGVLAQLERRFVLYRTWDPGLNSIKGSGGQFDEW